MSKWYVNGKGLDLGRGVDYLLVITHQDFSLISYDKLHHESKQNFTREEERT